MTGARRSRFVEYSDERSSRRFRVDFQHATIVKPNGLLKNVKKPAILEFPPDDGKHLCCWYVSNERIAGTPVNEREFKNRTEAQQTLDLLAKARGWKAVTE